MRIALYAQNKIDLKILNNHLRLKFIGPSNYF